MVPLHDTDLAEQRWAKAEWESVELWEKIEVRMRRRRRLWIAGALVLFVLLSSIPVILERQPRWKAIDGARRLAADLVWVRKQAGISKKGFVLSVEGAVWRISQVDRCASNTHSEFVREEKLEAQSEDLTFLSEAQAQALSVPGVISRWCYDPWQGSQGWDASRPDELQGFVVMPRVDLETQRVDRLATVLISGPSGDLAFE